MKKLYLILTLVFTTQLVSSQQIEKVVDYTIFQKGSYVKLNDDRNNPKNQKYWDFYLSFKDNTYQYLNEFSSLTFDLEQLKKFSSLLKQMSISEGEDLVVDGGFYRLRKSKNLDEVMIINTKDDAYFYLGKSKIEELDEIVLKLE